VVIDEDGDDSDFSVTNLVTAIGGVAGTLGAGILSFQSARHISKKETEREYVSHQLDAIQEFLRRSGAVVADLDPFVANEAALKAVAPLRQGLQGLSESAWAIDDEEFRKCGASFFDHVVDVIGTGIRGDDTTGAATAALETFDQLQRRAQELRRKLREPLLDDG
jgi:hypothetical protein